MIVAEKSRDILNKNKLAIEASKKLLEGRKRNVQKTILGCTRTKAASNRLCFS